MLLKKIIMKHMEDNLFYFVEIYNKNKNPVEDKERINELFQNSKKKFF